MAYTFYDVEGIKHLVDSVIVMDIDKDILSGEVTGYSVTIDGIRYEVDKRVYEKIRETP